MKLGDDIKMTVYAALDGEKNDGIGMLDYLNRTYGATSTFDATQALDSLRSITFKPNDTVDTYTTRFHKRLGEYNKCGQVTLFNSSPQLTIDEQVDIYLTRMLRTMLRTNPIYSTVVTLNSQHQRRVVQGVSAEAEDITIVVIQQELSAVESVLRGTQANSHRETRTAHANNAQTKAMQTVSAKYKADKCYGCGFSNHRLKDCKKTSDADKKRIYEEMRRKRNNQQRYNSNNNRSNYSRNQRNNSTNRPRTSNHANNTESENNNQTGTTNQTNSSNA